MTEATTVPNLEIRDTVLQLCSAKPGVPIGEEIIQKGPIIEIVDEIGISPKPWFESLSRDREFFLQAHLVPSMPEIYFVQLYRALQKTTERKSGIEKGIFICMYFIQPQLHENGLYYYEAFDPR
jgi:hypothetical protein